MPTMTTPASRLVVVGFLIAVLLSVFLLLVANFHLPDTNDFLSMHEYAHSLSTTTSKPSIAFSGSRPPKPPIPIDPSYAVIKRRPDGPPYAGVLVDTARSYFSIANLKTIVSFVAKIGLNLLHIRLTDDQSFLMNFTSHPELAAPTAGGVVYSVQEMKDLVQYASDRGVVVMPELNVPGHAAGWFGVPGLVPNCPRFACQQAFGVPLMFDDVRLIPLLRDLITELRDIFYTSPLIHLGGDETELGDQCLVEAGHVSMTSARNGSVPFERRLSHLLTEMDIPPGRVVRWEYTGLRSKTKDPSEDPRNDAYGNSTIKQYWHFSPRDDWSGVPREPYFVSTHFYIDTFDDLHDGHHMFEDARHLGFDEQYPPLGVITGTFELDYQGWTERNVYGKLLAFAMGLADANLTNATRAEFEASYDRMCPLVRPTNTSVEHWKSFCIKRGSPLVSRQQWHRRHTQNWASWRKHVCGRMK